jgi:hypothetical protein
MDPRFIPKFFSISVFDFVEMFGFENCSAGSDTVENKKLGVL